jgi:hypothetical protein
MDGMYCGVGKTAFISIGFSDGFHSPCGRLFAAQVVVLASLRSAAVLGVEALAVIVEVDVSFGLPVFTMVGLPDASVRESRDRVRTAIRNSGFEFPVIASRSTLRQLTSARPGPPTTSP